MSAAQARVDGQMAALFDFPLTENPHPLGSAESQAWARGHREVTGDLDCRPRGKRGVLV